MECNIYNVEQPREGEVRGGRGERDARGEGREGGIEKDRGEGRVRLMGEAEGQAGEKEGEK